MLLRAANKSDVSPGSLPGSNDDCLRTPSGIPSPWYLIASNFRAKPSAWCESFGYGVYHQCIQRGESITPLNQ